MSLSVLDGVGDPVISDILIKTEEVATADDDVLVLLDVFVIFRGDRSDDCGGGVDWALLQETC